MLDPERPGGWGAAPAASPASNSLASNQPMSSSSTQVNNPFATPFMQNQSQGQPGRNPFTAASPSFGQQQNTSMKPAFNPFQQQGTVDKPKQVAFGGQAAGPGPFSTVATSASRSMSSPFGNTTQTIGAKKVAEFVQPAWPKHQDGSTSTDPNPTAPKTQAKGKRKMVTDFQGRSKFSRSSPDPNVASIRSTSGPQSARSDGQSFKRGNLKPPTPHHNGRSQDVARKIQRQLAKDGVRPPPPWPANPGSHASRPAMEKLRESHRAYREKATKSLIQAGLFDDPDGKKTLREAIMFRGICEDMCPEWERITRIVERNVPGPEKEADQNGELVAQPSIMLTRLARSAAGQDPSLPMDVRTFSTLRRTLDYLIDELIPSDESLPSKHSFLWDRTRAIRIDFSRQKVSMTTDERNDLIYCLETITRFHVTSLHLLSRDGFASEDFSEQQEIEQLSKTLISLKELYDDCAKQGVKCENEAEFRGYYLVINARDSSLEEMIGSWGIEMYHSADIQKAYILARAMENSRTLHGPLTPHASTELAMGTAELFFSIVEQPDISYTLACFAEIHFNLVRKSMLQIIKRSYSRPRDGPKDFTPALLKQQLRFDTEQEAIDFTQQHGFELNGDGDHQYLVVSSRQPFIDARIRHSFSRQIVERKRSGRSLPDVIHKTVYEQVREEPSVPSPEESLFVDDSQDASFESTGDTASNGDARNGDSTPPSSPPVTTSLVPSTLGTKILHQPTGFGTTEAPTSIFAPSQNSTKVQTTGPFPPSTAQSMVQTTPAPFSSGIAPSVSSSWAPGTSSSADGEETLKNPVHGISGKTRTENPLSSGTSPAKGSSPAPSMFSFLNTSKGSTPASNAPIASAFSGLQPKMSDSPDQDTSKSSIFSGASSTPPTGPLFPGPSAASNNSKELMVTKASSNSSLFQTPELPDASSSTAQASPSGQDSTSLPPNPGSASPSAATASGLPTSATTAGYSGSLMEPPKPTQTSPLTPQTIPTSTDRIESTPKKDSMGDFTRWFVCADRGLMQNQLEQLAIEHILRNTWENFQVAEEERERREEDEKSWAEARKFRQYSLKVTYFYRWLDLFRKRRVIKRIQMEKEKARQWNLPENVAKRELDSKALREKSVQQAADLMERRTRGNIEKATRMRDSTKSRPGSSIEDALLASGVLRGVHNEKAAVRHAARVDKVDSQPDMLPGEKMLLRSENERRRKRGLHALKQFPEPKTYKPGSKTAKLKAISDGNGRDSMSLSTGSLRNSTFSSSYRSSLGFNNSRVSKPRSKVTDPYWRMKANGLVQMPNGEYLHESLALPMLQEGKRFPGLGDYGLPPEDSTSPSQSPVPSVEPGQHTAPLAPGMNGVHRSRVSSSPSIAADGPQRRKRARAEAQGDDSAAYIDGTTSSRKRAKSGESNDRSNDSDQDFLASIAGLMQDVDALKKSTSA